jgi:hypothetical protein
VNQKRAAFIGRMYIVFVSSLESVDNDDLRSHIAMGMCEFVHDLEKITVFQELFLGVF